MDEGVRAAAPELARGIWLRLAPVGHPGEGVPSAVPRATWTWEQGPPAGGADSGRGLLAGLSPEGALRVGALAESADRSALVIRWEASPPKPPALPRRRPLGGACLTPRPLAHPNVGSPDGAAGVNQTAALTASTAQAAAPVFAATSMAQQGSPHSVVAAAGVHEDGQSALYVVKIDTLVGGDSGDEEGREDPSEWTRLPSGQEVMAPEPVEDAPLALSASGARGLIAVGWGRRLLVLLADDDDDDEDEGEDGDED